MEWETPWDCFQPWDVEQFGPQILDRDEQARWSRAVFLGGLPWMWRRNGVIRELIYDRLELRPGDRVLLLGESIEPCGFAEDVRRRVGAGGDVRVIEIIDDARRAYYEGRRGAGGQLATFRYDYTREIPDAAFDCVAVLQGVQHSEDWRVTAAELLRVMRRGRRIVLGEIAFGPNFAARASADVHLEFLVEKLFARIGWHYAQFPYHSPQALRAAFDGLVTEPETFDWRGFELFWGRKA